MLQLSRSFNLHVLGAKNSFKTVTDRNHGVIHHRHPGRRPKPNKPISRQTTWKMAHDIFKLLQAAGPEEKVLVNADTENEVTGVVESENDVGDLERTGWRLDKPKTAKLLDTLKMRNLDVAYALSMTENEFKAALKEKDEADLTAHLLSGHTQRQITIWYALQKPLPLLSRSRMYPKKVREGKRVLLRELFGEPGTEILDGIGLGGQPFACVKSLRPMIDAVMRFLLDGKGRRVLDDEKYLIVLEQSEVDLDRAGDGVWVVDGGSIKSRVAALDRTATTTEIAAALGWGVDVIEKAYPVRGAWRVRLTKSHRSVEKRASLMIANVVVSKKTTEAHGSGLHMSMQKNKVVVANYPAGKSLDADVVAEHLNINGGELLVSTAVRRLDNLVVVTLTNAGIAERANLVQHHDNIHDLRVQLMTKGWDAVRLKILLKNQLFFLTSINFIYF
jgi:hypothetical protein